MRLILTGAEYAGKSTLGSALHQWGLGHGFQFHMDDHFTIPDASLRTDDEKRYALGAPPAMKERFQRFQIYYHLHLLQLYQDICLVGFHSEEAVYGPRYYYPGLGGPRSTSGLPQDYHRAIEHEFPEDTIYCLVTARPVTLRQRAREHPHSVPLVPEAELEDVQNAFEREFLACWLKRKIRLDTSDVAPDQLVPTFLQTVKRYLNATDLTRLTAHNQLP
jgi:hypothetical protein